MKRTIILIIVIGLILSFVAYMITKRNTQNQDSQASSQFSLAQLFNLFNKEEETTNGDEQAPIE